MSKLPQSFESKPDNNNIITRTEFKKNSNDEVVKVVKKIKTYTFEKKVYNSAVERQFNWIKFGAAAKDNNNVTFVSNELIFMEPPSSFKDKDASPFLKLEQNLCKICRGQHWTRICPKQLEIDIDKELNETIKPIEKEVEKEKQKEKVKQEYVPTINRDDMFTLQISSIPKDILEFDLYDIFSKLSKIKNILLMRDFNTQESKGFGFIVFEDENSLNTILKIFNNVGFCHLRIKLQRI
jgi:hypothetical protein